MVKPWSRVATSFTGRLSFFAAKRHEPGARRQLRLGAERAADERADDMHLGRIDAELLGDAVLQAVHELARLIDRQFAVAPEAVVVNNSIGL